MNYGKKVTGPKPRPAYANPKHPMNRETMMVDANKTAKVATPKPRPKRVYNGMTGNYSTD
jgi:hypothetical protein